MIHPNTQKILDKIDRGEALTDRELGYIKDITAFPSPFAKWLGMLAGVLVAICLAVYL